MEILELVRTISQKRVPRVDHRPCEHATEKWDESVHVAVGAHDHDVVFGHALIF